MALVPNIRDGDWTGVRKAIQQISSTKLGPKSSPTFASIKLADLIQGSILFAGAAGLISQDNTNLSWDDTNKILALLGTLNASAGKVRVRDDAANKPTAEDDGYLSVYEDGAAKRFYTFIGGRRYYVNLTIEADVGEPIGLLLALTYAT